MHDGWRLEARPTTARLVKTRHWATRVTHTRKNTHYSVQVRRCQGRLLTVALWNDLEHRQRPSYSYRVFEPPGHAD
jgi:hypothetical protein